MEGLIRDLQHITHPLNTVRLQRILSFAREQLPGDDGIIIPVIAVAAGFNSVDIEEGAGAGHVVGIGEFKGEELGVVEVVDHHSIDSVIVVGKTVSGEVQVVVLRKIQIDMENEVQVSKVRVIPSLIIAGTAGENQEKCCEYEEFFH